MNISPPLKFVLHKWWYLLILSGLVLPTLLRAQDHPFISYRDTIHKLVNEKTQLRKEKIILAYQIEQLEARNQEMSEQMAVYKNRLQYLDERYHYIRSTLVRETLKITLERRMHNGWQYVLLGQGSVISVDEFQKLRVQFLTGLEVNEQKTYFLNIYDYTNRLVPTYSQIPLNAVNGKVDQIIPNIQLPASSYFLEIYYKEDQYHDFVRINFTLVQ